MSKLETHFALSGSLAFERKKLRGRTQQPGDSVTEYLAALHHFTHSVHFRTRRMSVFAIYFWTG